MTQAQFQAAARYWEEKDAASVKLDPAQLRSVAEAYIQANNTCALATGAGAYVPVSYTHLRWIYRISKPAWDAGHGQGRDRGALFPGLFGPCGL